MRIAFFIILLACFAFKSIAADVTFSNVDKPKETGPKLPYIGFVEVFGTPQIKPEEFKRLISKPLEACILASEADTKKCAALEKEFFAGLKQKYDWKYLSWSFLTNYDPKHPYTNVFVDVVKTADEKTRMNFNAEPTKTFADPQGLLSAWMAYEKKGFDLARTGEIRMDAIDPQTKDCPALQCPFGHNHPQLASYKAQFVKGAKTQFEKLVEIAKEDQDFFHRAAALQVLAYADKKQQVVSLLAQQVRDPNELVRNVSLRMLGDITQAKPEWIHPDMYPNVVEALYYPKVSDRMKAAYSISLWIEKHPEIKNLIYPKYLEPLVMMLSSVQPENQEFAHTILKKVSKEDFGKENIAAWKNWAIKENRAIAKKD